MKSFYYYVIDWCDKDDNYAVKTSKGILTAESFYDVANKLEEYFGCIQTLTVDAINDDDIITPEDLQEYLENKTPTVINKHPDYIQRKEV